MQLDVDQLLGSTAEFIVHGGAALLLLLGAVLLGEVLGDLVRRSGRRAR